MSEFSHAKALYLDIEQQCWNGAPPEGYINEIIQLGIVETDLLKLEITRRSSYLVRPLKMQISPFCTELTGITERALTKGGRSFNERLHTIRKQFGPSHKLCFTWGDDAHSINRECELRKKDHQFNFVNLAWVFRCYFGIKRGIGLENALKMLGLEFEGRPHDAMWDAYNTARIHLALIQRLRSAGTIFEESFSVSTAPLSISHYELAIDSQRNCIG